MEHLRARINKAVKDLLNPLADETVVNQLGFPRSVKIVLNYWRHYTGLDKQSLIPAILINPGRDGRSPDSDVIGYAASVYPLNIITVLKEIDPEDPLLDQNSDMHYSIERILNGNRDLGLGEMGVLNTRIIDFGNTEENLHPFLLTKYRIHIEHEYGYTEGV